MPTEAMNELTFAGWLAGFTAVHSARKEASGQSGLIASAAIEEKQVDAQGTVRRCDLRFNSRAGRKLVSGELKRPEVPEGRDPRNEKLRGDARRKAIARGLPYYFTCNIASVVLYLVSSSGRAEKEEIGYFQLAPIEHSRSAAAYRSEIEQGWAVFLDQLEVRLAAFGPARPRVTTHDVIAVRNAIYMVEDEVLARALRRVSADPMLAEDIRAEAERSFNFPAALNARFPDVFREDLMQILRFGAFVITQKLILYQVLKAAGARRATPYFLDDLAVNRSSSDPSAIRASLEASFALAIRRSEDYETAFQPQSFIDLVFSLPEGSEEAAECEVGQVWHHLITTVVNVSWQSIEQNIVGTLYEVIVEERFRHQLGQFYTPEDIVDLLNTFALRQPGELVLDPATGGGSFLRSAYLRKRALGEDHTSALSTLYGCEITAFAAELSTVTLATSDPGEPAAYPRVLLRDFFDLRPGMVTELKIPGEPSQLSIPTTFDAIIGNPPYISYRRLSNQKKILNALASAPVEITLPRFYGQE